MPDDLLEIKIAGANEATSALINTYSTTSATNTSNYLVDNNGEVEFPLIGKLKAAGLTKEQFRDVLRERATKFLKDPLISVRFVNFRFSVLGEVRSPGTFTIANEKITILEAMGLAGDLTNYAKRANVRVIRDSLGKREIGIVNFNDKAIFTSPYYYLQRNDVIYIEPEKYKSKYEDFSRVTSIIATLASLVAIAITVLRK
jgi:polysaccharide export outer membrane protein